MGPGDRSYFLSPMYHLPWWHKLSSEGARRSGYRRSGNSLASTDARKLAATKVMLKDRWYKKSFSLYGIRIGSSSVNTGTRKFPRLESTTNNTSRVFLIKMTNDTSSVFLIKKLFNDQWYKKSFSVFYDHTTDKKCVFGLQIKLVGNRHIQDKNSLHRQLLQNNFKLFGATNAFHQPSIQIWRQLFMWSINICFLCQPLKICKSRW